MADIAPAFDDKTAVDYLTAHGLPGAHIERNAERTSIVWGGIGAAAHRIDYPHVNPSSGIVAGGQLTEDHLVLAVLVGGDPKTVTAVVPSAKTTPAAQTKAAAVHASASKK